MTAKYVIGRVSPEAQRRGGSFSFKRVDRPEDDFLPLNLSAAPHSGSFEIETMLPVPGLKLLEVKTPPNEITSYVYALPRRLVRYEP